ncbi:MAG: CopD family protein [Pseudomonadota bacterium]
MLYLWLKAAHILAIVAWMAGLLYLPRLFVYHAATTETEFRARINTWEGLLYRRIMRPAMIATLILGFWLMYLGWRGWNAAGITGWLWVKITIALGLVGYHHYCGALIRRFADGNPHSERWFRFFNEVPTLGLIVILIMVVLKPF